MCGSITSILATSLWLPFAVGRGGSETCAEIAAGNAFVETAGLLQKYTAQTQKQGTPNAMILHMTEDESDFSGATDPIMIGAKKPSLCDPDIVASTCKKLNGGKHVDVVTTAQIQNAQSLNRSTANAFWKALSFEPAETVSCMKLCTAVIDIVQNLGGVLPTSSDVACYTLHGITTCNVDVEPHGLAKDVGDALASKESMNYTDDVDVDPDVTTRLLQHRVTHGAHGLMTFEHLNNSQSSGAVPKDFCPYTLWQVVERTANFFRIFPSSGADLSIFIGSGLASTTNMDAEAKIAKCTVQAKAWVATVLVELANQRTEPFRQEWFGGAGALDAMAVRNRILLTMNFIDRELDDVHYVYPADLASDTSCRNSAGQQTTTVAYVWKWRSDADDYEETRGPRCSSWGDDPLTKHCAVDESGRYYVYLCEYWNDLSMNVEVATLVHEAAHHTGPGDIEYDKALMKQLSQFEQLDNAANYENFAGEVAQSAWGCVDSDAVPGYTCRRGGQPVPCPCSTFRSECSTNSNIKRLCPATCGDCLAPSFPPTPQTPPTPMPAAPPSPEPTASTCRDSDVLTGFTCSQNGQPVDCECFQLTSYCSISPQLRAQCAFSCGDCSPLTPRPEPPTAEPTQLPTLAPPTLTPPTLEPTQAPSPAPPTSVPTSAPPTRPPTVAPTRAVTPNSLERIFR